MKANDTKRETTGRDRKTIERLENEVDVREAKRILAKEAGKGVPLDEVLARHGLKK